MDGLLQCAIKDSKVLTYLLTTEKNSFGTLLLI